MLQAVARIPEATTAMLHGRHRCAMGDGVPRHDLAGKA